MSNQDLIEKARKRVKEKKQFYNHLGAFSVFAVFMFLINLMTSPGTWWFIWAIAGWGMAVLGHYFRVFGIPGLMGRNWESDQFEKELEKLEQEKRYQEELELPPEELELKDPVELEKKYNEDDLV